MVKLSNFVRRYTSIASVIDILRRKELSLLDPQSWDDRNDRYFMDLYKESKDIRGLYGLCAATCSETYHHWRVFTNAADGACIEIKRDALEDRLDQLNGVNYGVISYLKLEEVEQLGLKDADRLPFVKRVGFEPEDEYRIIAETMEQQQPAIQIDLPVNLINRIYLNPWLPKSIADSVKDTLRALPGCSKIVISKSYLIESGRWKKAGDKVLGRKQPLTIKRGKSKSST